jgi:hypothetical protein
VAVHAPAYLILLPERIPQQSLIRIPPRHLSFGIG